MSITIADRRPTRKPDVDFRILDDLTSVAVAPESEEAHALTPVATAVFERCDGTMTVGEIAAELADIFDAPADQIARDVEAFLDDLVARGLVEW